MKLRVTIDTDECGFDSIEPHVMHIDNDGVATMWYGSPSYFVPFNDVEIISCDHKCGTRRVRNDYTKTLDCHDECYNCGNTVDSMEYVMLKENEND